MNDCAVHDDIHTFQVVSESPPQRSREPTSAGSTYDAPWPPSFMPGAWPIADEGLSVSAHGSQGYREVNQDGDHSAHPSRSPGAIAPQASITLSPITDMFGDFSFGDQSSGIYQEMFPDEQEHQYNDGALYPIESHSLPHHRRTPSLFTQPSLPSGSATFQDSWHPVGVSEQRRPTQNNFSLFLTDGGQSTAYPAINTSYHYDQSATTDSSLGQWRCRTSTPSSSFTSPTIETPSPLRSDISSLPNSPCNHSSSFTPPPPLIIPHFGRFLSYTNGYSSNGTLSTKVQYEQYNGTVSAGPSHPTSAIDDTMLSPFYVQHPSHAMLHSAPPSPSLPLPYRQSISAEQGTRRHSDSSGGDCPQGVASANPELARFRQDTRGGRRGRDASTGSMRPGQHIDSQMHPVHEGPVLGDEVFPHVVLKNTIASTATLEAANKRRKKTALFACSICSQTLTSPDNLRSHVDAHTGRKRHLCQYCSRRFRTRSVLLRHQKSKICSAPKFPTRKK